ncbi:hypothetical protein [Bacillus canaveralius]|uniref:hypothetical protein n=1 Tax=Bacillus canaveralius TaxID=1403243 RepID=UPI001639FD98|nr:hypothetical protein [Bacillus canaveralius]
MQAVQKRFPKLQLDIDKLRANAETLKVNKEGVIMLDRNNPTHRDWFEDNKQ